MLKKQFGKAIQQLSKSVTLRALSTLRIARRALLVFLQDNESMAVARAVGLLTKMLLGTAQTTLFRRRVLDYSSRSNPLNSDNRLPPIHLHIVAASKDFSLLPLAITQALAHCSNPIEKVVIIVPDAEKDQVPRLPPDVQVIGESAILPKSIFSTIESHHPKGRKGWVLQQALKFWSVRNSSSSGVLVLDADTLLTKRRTFLSHDGKQLLCYSHEYHRPYELHAARVWGARRRDIGLSYVCHHQLMQPDVVRDMFPTVKYLNDWILASDISERSPLSDYHSYGRWLADNYPSRFIAARWGNKSFPIKRGTQSTEKQVLEHLQTLPKNCYSASFHHYLE